MHHFVYPSQDTFITNISGYEDLNFGLNEILRVGCQDITTKITLSTKSFPISQSLTNFCLTNFSGSIVSATLYGTASHAVVSITSNVNSNVSSSNFTGTLTGSYWSASISSSNYTGSLGSFSGSFSGIFNGTVSGSIWTDYIPHFNGSVSDFTGKIINGFVLGIQTLNQQNTIVQTNAYVNRALVQFDLSAISNSMVNGDISNPSFKLKMKVAREENLPIQYSIYAFPIAESWVMGDGYYFDGGSIDGVSWTYRDYQGGTTWSLAGGDFVTSPASSQSFNYEAGDISMDVTNVANGWLNGTVSNNGLMIMSSDEFTTITGSGLSLYFFSRDTNTIYSPYLDVSWNDATIVTGSIVTSSVNITTVNAGVTGSIQTGSVFSIPGGGINGIFSGDAFLTLNVGTASGIVIGVGETGDITNMSIIGTVSGISSLTSSTYSGSCGKIFDAYLLTASFINGPFSGSTFGAFYTNYRIENAVLTGSWPPATILANTVTIPLPSGIDPFAYAYVTGPYVYGKALGQYVLSSSNSASFIGQFIEGNYIGGTLDLQLSGSVNTAIYSYTSSLNIENTDLDPLQVSSPFVVVVTLPEKVKNNQIIKVAVSGREQFPLKNFQRLPQFSQFLTPLYLPSSSFYAIKDNETEEIILDFDNYTRLSCDTNGNYFMLDTSGLPQERYFKVLIKVEQSGSIYVVDNNNIFKVVR